MRLALVVLCALLAAGCGPSCEDLGGKQEFVENVVYFIPIYTGQTTIILPQTMPVYRCVMPEKR